MLMPVLSWSPSMQHDQQQLVYWTLFAEEPCLSTPNSTQRDIEALAATVDSVCCRAMVTQQRQHQDSPCCRPASSTRNKMQHDTAAAATLGQSLLESTGLRSLTSMTSITVKKLAKKAAAV